MNRKIVILSIIFIIICIVIISYILIVNKIKKEFSSTIINVVEDNEKKQYFLENAERFMSINLFRKMPDKEKENFMNNPEAYKCYKIDIEINNKSKYNADTLEFVNLEEMKKIWIDENLGFVAAPSLKAQATKTLSMYIISDKNEIVDKNSIFLETKFYIENNFIKQITVKSF